MKVKSLTIAGSAVLYLAGWALGAGTIQDSKTFRADDFTIGEVVEQDKETYATVVPPGGKAVTLLAALVWNPRDISSGDSLYQTLLRADYQATLTTDLSSYLDSLDNYHLFVMAGFAGQGGDYLSWEEFEPFSATILSFLDGGGSVYWEGAQSYTFIVGHASRLFDYFPVFVYSNTHPIDYLRGRDSSIYGPLFTDIDSLLCGGATTDLECLCGYDEADALIAYSAFGGYASAAVICQVGETRTMMTDFSWAWLNDSGANTRVDLIHDVMDWLSGAVAVEELEPLPTEFSLSQNYPNPFNAQTTIDYALPKGGPIKLQVYDIGGRVVATLVNGAMPAGYHQVVWDAKGMSSGLYFLRIQAGEFAETKKMVLMK